MIMATTRYIKINSNGSQAHMSRVNVFEQYDIDARHVERHSRNYFL